MEPRGVRAPDDVSTRCWLSDSPSQPTMGPGRGLCQARQPGGGLMTSPSKRTLTVVGIVVVVILALVGGVLWWGMSGTMLTIVVEDARTGQPIEGAEVSVGEETFDASTGEIAEKLPLGECTVVVSAPGYESTETVASLAIFQPVDLGTVGIRNASVEVSVVENYPGSPVVGVASVTFGESEESTETTGGTVALVGLPIGETELRIAARGCMPSTMSVDLMPGDNSVVCTITPELAVVVQRHGEAMKGNNYPLVYDLMHPARQKLWGTKTEYLDIMESSEEDRAGITISEIRVNDVLEVGEYKDKATGGTYQGVFRVPTTYVVTGAFLAVLGQESQSFSESQYWLLEDGQWRSLSDGERSVYMP